MVPRLPLGPAEYDAIEAAVMETSRGRRFLAEYTRRNRQADTVMLLSAIERLEGVVRGHRPGVSEPDHGDAATPRPADDSEPLAALDAMSYEERIALFT